MKNSVMHVSLNLFSFQAMYQHDFNEPELVGTSTEIVQRVKVSVAILTDLNLLSYQTAII